MHFHHWVKRIANLFVLRTCTVATKAASIHTSALDRPKAGLSSPHSLSLPGLMLLLHSYPFFLSLYFYQYFHLIQMHVCLEFSNNGVGTFTLMWNGSLWCGLWPAGSAWREENLIAQWTFVSCSLWKWQGKNAKGKHEDKRRTSLTEWESLYGFVDRSAKPLICRMPGVISASQGFRSSVPLLLNPS